MKAPTCFKCGRPVDSSLQELCFECAKKDHSYSAGFAVFIYNEDMRKAMSDFKFNNRRDNADFFIEELVKASQSFVRIFEPTCFVPVPVHSSRLRERGFNQALILAEGLSEGLDIPIKEALKRTKKTLPQKKLSDKERVDNLRQAFAIDEAYKDIIYGARILLVDDIYTTGSTVAACSEVLLEGGAETVGFVSVCIGKGN